MLISLAWYQNMSGAVGLYGALEFEQLLFNLPTTPALNNYEYFDCKYDYHPAPNKDYCNVGE